jgi:phosphatidylglycerophosphate synthase
MKLRPKALKTLADVLTASRFVIAGLIVFWAIRADYSTLGKVIISILIGWTTDILDGPIARRSAVGEGFWGRTDFIADMAMVWAGFFYMAQVGILSQYLALAYFMLVLLFLLLTRSKSVLMAFSVPATALPLVVALDRLPSLGIAFLVWIALALIIDHRRFIRVVVEFLHGMGKWLGRGSAS